jgi:hypothetical protein
MDVDGDKTFYTLTMARVYADQGQYEEAAPDLPLSAGSDP